MKRYLSFLLLCTFLLATPLAIQAGRGPSDPFVPEVTLSTSEVHPGETFEVRAKVEIPKGHYLYRDRSSLTLDPNDAFRLGETRFPPAKKKKDPFTKEDVFVYPGEQGPMILTLPVTVREDAPPGRVKLSALLRYQGCNEKICFFPAKRKFDLSITILSRMTGREKSAAAGDAALPPPPAAGKGARQRERIAVGKDATSPLSGAEGPSPRPSGTPAPTAAGETSAQQGNAADISARFTRALDRGVFWALLFAFVGGFLTSLTPCVYPLIPITIGIFGGKNVKSRLHGFLLSVVYVLGIAAMYSSLGVIAALTGAVFGAFMANPIVIVVIASVFVLAALATFGVFRVTLPPALNAKLSGVAGEGYTSAFLMGLVSGFIAAPCTGPVLAAVLTFVSTTGNAFLGFWLLFVFALGMGVLFMLLGAGAVSTLPKLREKSDFVERALGVIFLAAALYFLRPLLPEALFTLLVGALIIGVAVFLGALTPLSEDAGGARKFRKTVAILLFIPGIYLFGGTILRSGFLLPPLHLDVAAPTPAPEVTWLRSEAEALALGRTEKRAIVIDFSADWCIACKELERITFADPSVQARLARLVTARIDFTRTTPQTRYLTEKYRIKGLPHVAFLTPEGKILHDLTITGFVSPEEFLSILDTLSARAGKEGDAE